MSFGGTPRDQVSGQRTACTGRVLVRTHHRGIRADRPVRALGLITASPQDGQDVLPGAIARPAAVPLVHRQPVPVLARQIPPRAARPGAEQDPVDRPPAFDRGRYKERNTVERCFSKLKQFRAVATRYDKREQIYQGTVDVASIRIWLRDPVP